MKVEIKKGNITQVVAGILGYTAGSNLDRKIRGLLEEAGEDTFPIVQASHNLIRLEEYSILGGSHIVEFPCITEADSVMGYLIGGIEYLLQHLPTPLVLNIPLLGVGKAGFTLTEFKEGLGHIQKVYSATDIQLNVVCLRQDQVDFLTSPIDMSKLTIFVDGARVEMGYTAFCAELVSQGTVIIAEETSLQQGNIKLGIAMQLPTIPNGAYWELNIKDICAANVVDVVLSLATFVNSFNLGVEMTTTAANIGEEEVIPEQEEGIENQVFENKEETYPAVEKVKTPSAFEGWGTGYTTAKVETETGGTTSTPADKMLEKYKNLTHK